MYPPRKKRRVLFPEAIRPVPKRIQELRARTSRLSDSNNASLRALSSDIFDGPDRYDLSTVLDQLARSNELAKEREEIRKMKKEIKEWEKEGTARSRGYMGLRRVLHSFQAYKRLRRMRARAHAKQELSDLELLHALSKGKKLRRYEQIRYENLKGRERRNKRVADQK
jgi:hypothetical protein